MTTVEARLFGFLRGLRDAGVSVPANKQGEFLAGIETLAPSSMGQLYWVGAATLVTSEPDLRIFDEEFRRFFGSSAAATVVTEEPAPEETETAVPGEGAGDDALVVGPPGGSGLAAARAGHDAVRRFAATTPRGHELIRQLCRELPAALPRTRSRRHRTGGRRQRVDLRAIYLESRRTHGEIMRLHWRHRPPRERRVLLLIDVSGSMKQHSPDYLRFAYAVVATCAQAEVFTFGTRLTRVTATLRVPDVDAALAALARVVLDADGGTLIGPTLQAFLDQFASMARGALVLVLSDGLERGDCTAMVAAVRRLSLLAHQLTWWSPLACDPAYRPLTRGMSAVRPDLDALTGVGDLDTALTAVRDRFARTPGKGVHV
ncbi:VWA domain-containing protein [Asanoa sp. NPDC049573]|uniref:vWA domain-containing protein n=1 Tax=Asanoa sp. NPDC049573 TaxID=3155396 RepID=UPI00343E5634